MSRQRWRSLGGCRGIAPLAVPSATLCPGVMSMRKSLATGWVVSCALLSCSSSTTSGGGLTDGGGGFPPGSPADAFVQAFLSAGQNGGRCPLSGNNSAIVAIGTPTMGKPTTVQDGGSNGGANVSIACKVSASGSGFSLDLSAEEQGQMGATLSLTGTVDDNTGGTNVTASLGSVNDGTYISNACTVTWEYQGAMVPVTPEVAARRVWGHVSCPAAQNSQQDIMGQPAECDLEADFLFEQCGE